jgi:hypothetical protein
MIKYTTLLALLFYFAGISQETKIIQIDRFENDKNNWGLIDNKEEVCALENGKLIIENKRKNSWTYFSPENLKGFQNKAYTEISFDFSIAKVDLENNGGVGFLFINSISNKNFENVRLLIGNKNSYFSKSDWLNVNDSFTLDNSFKTPKLENTNSVKIVLDNQEKPNGENLQLFINNVKVFESNFNISNFNEIGLFSYGLHKTAYDNLVIKQSEEENYVVDAFDFLSTNGKLVIDHNGIETSHLTKYIPIEIVDNQNILSTKDLIKNLKKNSKCSSFEKKRVDFKGKKREMFSFNYGNSLIEFFTDTDKPNPIEINFLEKDDLYDFFKIYSDYNSYRYTDENRSQWPSQTWFSILRFDDSFRATIWRGI